MNKIFFEHYSGLLVAEDGEVMWITTYKKSKRTRRAYGRKKKDGHLDLTVKKKHYLIHKLVAEVFLNNNQPLQKGYDVHHIDGNPDNNTPDNLLILTHEEHSKLHNSNNNNPMFGKHPSEETKRKISEALKGKLKSDETKAKMSKTRKEKYGKKGKE